MVKKRLGHVIKACFSCLMQLPGTIVPVSVIVTLKFRMQRMRRGSEPLKGNMSAQKAFQEYETDTGELLVVTKVKQFLPS